MKGQRNILTNMFPYLFYISLVANLLYESALTESNPMKFYGHLKAFN